MVLFGCLFICFVAMNREAVLDVTESCAVHMHILSCHFLKFFMPLRALYQMCFAEQHLPDNISLKGNGIYQFCYIRGNCY